ncbi:MAG: energy transducer TonB [candidate division WOR-3 bacterium]
MRANFNQTDLADLGTRSPVIKVYTSNLKRAFYSTNSLIFLIIILVFAYIKYHQWQYHRWRDLQVKRTETRTIIIEPWRIGPPPSITGNGGDGGIGNGTGGVKSVAPAVGVPKPVPDDKAVQITIPTQFDIAGTGIFQGNGGIGYGVDIKIQDIPDIDTFIPHEVAPRVISKPPLIYPQPAVLMEQEGKVWIKALVDLDGSIMKAVVLKSSSFPLLDSAAVANIYGWRLSPALQNKNPVRVWVTMPIEFKLQK